MFSMNQASSVAERHLLLLCSECGDDRPFVQPPCEDGHGVECPEWSCVDCGAAVLVAPPTQPDQPAGSGPSASAATGTDGPAADTTAPASTGPVAIPTPGTPTSGDRQGGQLVGAGQRIVA
jgi:hypothetical protein